MSQHDNRVKEIKAQLQAFGLDHIIDLLALHTNQFNYAQNKAESLAKGHSTLTKRVQELESELKAQKEKGFTLMTPRGMECYDARGNLRVATGTVEKKTTSAADAKLQADIEALAGRVNTLENDPLVSIRFSFDKHADEAIRRAIQPGGILHDHLL